eukprot:scaffold672_cov268-Pinguiococcus_pyrenoidosus.AAC.14
MNARLILTSAALARAAPQTGFALLQVLNPRDLLRAPATLLREVTRRRCASSAGHSRKSPGQSGVAQLRQVASSTLALRRNLT